MILQLNNFRIRTRLIFGFSVILLFLMGLIAAAWFGITANEASVKMMSKEHLRALILSNKLASSAASLDISLRSLGRSDEATIKALMPIIEKARTTIDDSFAELQTLNATDEELDYQNQIDSAKTKVFKHSDEVLELLKTDPEASWKKANQENADIIALNAAVQKLAAFQEGETVTEVKKTIQMTKTIKFAIVGCGAFIFLFSVFVSYKLSTSILQPINESMHAITTISSGDLTFTTNNTGKDEGAQLVRALEAMSGELAKIVRNVRSGADQIATASAEIASGNADLSHRTEQQAANLQETAASMDEMTATVQNATHSANQAAQLAQSASRVAKTGGESVQAVVQTMEDITKSSKKISDIIGVIDGIAFQTNILALNAAVEAARAGEHGRGFSVVASEVRALAQRSATAAKEIKHLIDESVTRIEQGNHQVNAAGKTIVDVVTHISKVNDLVSEIASAANEQHKGIVQINQAITQMDQGTQQNAALVEESAAASESMRTQSSKMVELVSHFQLGDVLTTENVQPVVPHSKPTLEVKKFVAPITKPSVQTTVAEPKKVLPSREPVKSESSDQEWETF